jgi:predicted nucleic acid-binding protein
MILADTSIWIEFLRAREPVFSALAPLLEQQAVFGVQCVFAELLQGARTSAERRTILAYWENIPKVNEQQLWIEAGQYSGEHNLLSKGVGLIDAAIMVAGSRSAAMIWTLDERLARALGKAKTYVP